MPLANWLDDFVKDFVRYMANRACECFVFLWGRPLFKVSIDSFIRPLMPRNT